MDVLNSTLVNSRIDEEDKDVEEGLMDSERASSHVELETSEIDSEAEAKPPSPFDLLPAELVETIAAFVAFRPDTDTFGADAFDSLQSFALDRRTYSIAKPVIASRWHIWDNNLGQLAGRSDLANGVRTLQHTAMDTDSSVEDTILASFPHLQSLKLVGWNGRSTDLVPRSTTDALKTLKHLTSLAFDYYEGTTDNETSSFEDESFSLGASFPHLRTLHLGHGSTSTQQLLKNPPRYLRELKLYACTARNNHFGVIPWSSLTSLSVPAYQCLPGFRPMQELANSLSVALIPNDIRSSRAKVPLNRLELRADLFVNSYKSDDHTLKEQLHLLSVLAQTSVVELRFQIQSPLARPAATPTLPSVKRLVCAAYDFWASDQVELLSLFRLLSHFPSLETLQLSNCKFAAIPEDDPVCRAPNSAKFLLLHPTLTSFVAALRMTSLRAFTWQRSLDSFRWVRSNVQEDFQVDRYVRI